MTSYIQAITVKILRDMKCDAEKAITQAKEMFREQCARLGFTYESDLKKDYDDEENAGAFISNQDTQQQDVRSPKNPQV